MDYKVCILQIELIHTASCHRFFLLNNPEISGQKPATGDPDQIPQKRLLGFFIYHELRSGHLHKGKSSLLAKQDIL